MNPALWYALVGAGLVGIGLHGLILTPNLLRKIIALNIMGNGTFLVLVSLSKRLPEFAHPDPVPQAMVLTGVVVAVSATALALALLCRYYEATGRLVLPENRPGWGVEESPPAELPAWNAAEEGVEDEH